MSTGFNVLELTIKKYHKALKEGETTCTETVQRYHERITRYDDRLGSMVVLNPNMHKRAEELDQEYYHQKLQDCPECDDVRQVFLAVMIL